MTCEPSRGAGVSVLAAAKIQPLQQEKLPPCSVECPAGADVRGWIALVAQRRKLALSDHDAYARAWATLTAVNPFPAVMGRVCPHPCEANCSRVAKDGAIAINALERFLGDWALAHGLRLPRLAGPWSRPESIGVIGAGPAGLSFAYQMARRGYHVTAYEKASKPGGMLYYGIPQYRLPEQVLEAEVARILDLGVELQLETTVGRDISLTALRNRHEVLFIGIGAGRRVTLGIPGEEGPGTWSGIEYLCRVNRGEPVKLGSPVVVVGGGNTAVDAARVARRAGADVTMLYRRTRAEMPAIEAEVDDALAEGVQMVWLAAPVEIARENGQLRALVVQRMEMGEPDASGRRMPLPVPGSEYDLPAEAVIAAVSQQPDWDGLSERGPGGPSANRGCAGELDEGLWTGGDARGPGIASRAVGEGRQAAEAVHARLQRLTTVPPPPALSSSAIKPDFYADRQPISPPRQPADQRLTHPDAEVQDTISERAFLQEVSRCFSCGLCYGCEQCFMYCNAGAFATLGSVRPGAYFSLNLDRCQSCGKCVDLCPCGFLTPQTFVAPA